MSILTLTNELPVPIIYKNHAGKIKRYNLRLEEHSDYTESGRYLDFYVGTSKYYTTEQVLFDAVDTDRMLERTFALNNLIAWGQEAVDAWLALHYYELHVEKPEV